MTRKTAKRKVGSRKSVVGSAANKKAAPVAKKRTTKNVAAKKTTAKRTTKTNQKSKIKNQKLNGLSPATRQVAKAVKTAKKEGEKAAQKKLVKASKTKMEKVLKDSKEKINKLLKQSNERITKILKGDKRKAAAKTPRQRTESPFDMRRFRGVKKKKETTKQRLNRLSNEVSTIREHILFGIANGSFKFKWTDVKKETGWGTGEHRKMLTLWNDKGYTIKSLAEKIWEDNDGWYGKGVSDHDIRNEIIDVLSTVSSPGEALKELDRGQGNGKKVPF